MVSIRSTVAACFIVHTVMVGKCVISHWLFMEKVRTAWAWLWSYSFGARIWCFALMDHPRCRLAIWSGWRSTISQYEKNKSYGLKEKTAFSNRLFLLMATSSRDAGCFSAP